MTFLVFACGIRFFTLEIKKSKEFKGFKKALIKSEIFDRLVIVLNIIT